MHFPITKKFEKRKVYSSFKDNIWGADLADMQLISKYNTGIWFLLDVIDIFSKYAWVVPFKDKNKTIITNGFQNISNKSGRKPTQVWVDKSSEFCKRAMKS